MNSSYNLRPSASHKWVNCTASPEMEAAIPIMGSSEIAEEGTKAHALAEALFKDRSATCDDSDMLEYVTEYVDLVRSYGLPMVEVKVSFSELMGGGSGTCDAYTEGLSESGGFELTVHDLKYGYRQIDAPGNTQLLMYAHGLYHALGRVHDSIRLVIHQPRINHVSEVVYTILEATKQWAPIIEAVRSIRDENTQLTAGSWCTKHYCAAAATCPALRDRVGEAVRRTLSLDTLGDNFKDLTVVKEWAKAVEDAAYTAVVLNGERVPGLKAVYSRAGNRKWLDPEAVEGIVNTLSNSEDFYKKTLLSYAQAEKLCKGTDTWKLLSSNVTQDPPKLIVVTDDDKREAVDNTTLLTKEV